MERVDLITIKISGKMLWQKFHICDADYITNKCKGRCCEGREGISVVVHESEVARISSYGVVIEAGFIKRDNRNRCPFKQNDGLCGIHDDKPFGCNASPFTVNDNGMIIIRNRYRLFCCYKDLPSVPAFESHKRSLLKIFGEEEVDNIISQVNNHLDIIVSKISSYNYKVLMDNHICRKRINGGKYATTPMF
uniref:Putative zinc-or iron-chelating protein n=1 Tax=viral metagenome TaxID=1070528 RepID=A0A6M3KVZ7_9ZZZZ